MSASSSASSSQTNSSKPKTLDFQQLEKKRALVDSIKWKSDVNAFIKQYPVLVELILDFYHADKLFVARERRQSLLEAIATHLSTLGSLPVEKSKSLIEKLQDMRSECETNELFCCLVNESEEVDQLLKQLVEDEGWELAADTDNIKCHYRSEEGTPVHSLRIQGDMNVPAFNIMAIIKEIDQYHRWVPFLEESKVLLDLSKYRKAVYARLGLTWPMSDRSLTLFGSGFDLLERDMVVIIIRSFGEGQGDIEKVGGRHHEQLMAVRPKPNKNHVPIDVKFAGFLIIPKGKNKTRLVVIANADPQMSALPYWLLNFGQRKLGPMMFSKLEEIASNLKGTIYEERMTSQPEIYGEIKYRLANLTNKQNEQQQQQQQTNVLF